MDISTINILSEYNDDITELYLYNRQILDNEIFTNTRNYFIELKHKNLDYLAKPKKLLKISLSGSFINFEPVRVKWLESQ